MLKLFKKIFSAWFALPAWKKILFAMLLGVVCGPMLGPNVRYLAVVGALFIKAIKMMIVPMIFTAIVCAVLSMQDMQKMRRIGVRTILVYALSMLVAAIVGLCVATLIGPGHGLALPYNASDMHLPHMPTFLSLFKDLIPSNALVAFSTANILQILVFSLFMGLAIHLAGPAANPVKQFFQGFSAVVFKLANLVMSFAPYGIFALMATTTGEYGYPALLPLFKLIVAGYLSCIVLALVFYVPVLKMLGHCSPVQFFRGTLSAILFAFSSSSSTATLPESMRCAQENLGIPKNIAGFLLPLGTTLNLNGLAIYLAIATVFAANIYQVHLDFTHYVTLLITIVLTSMGAGGIPGSALIVMGAVMSSIGLPLGAIPLIAGVDRVIDMGMTATNVTGDLFATTIVANFEKKCEEAEIEKAESEESITNEECIKECIKECITNDAPLMTN